jgi:hypothetical protein
MVPVRVFFQRQQRNSKPMQPPRLDNPQQVNQRCKKEFRYTGFVMWNGD